MHQIINALTAGDAQVQTQARDALALFPGLSKVERSILAYAECCCVDSGGLLEAIRMNNDDMTALRKFQDLGVLRHGRVPGRLLGTGGDKNWTHWVELAPTGWLLAAMVRAKRSEQRGPFAKQVFEVLEERTAA
jgi:hypothetical protein